MGDALCAATAGRSGTPVCGLRRGGALIASKRLHAEVEPILKESFKAKEAVKLGRSATVLAFSGTACALLAKKSRSFGVVAGALLFTGALAEKFSVYRAGYISAKDPKYAFTLQRQRIDARGGEPTRLREPSHDGRAAGSVSA